MTKKFIPFTGKNTDEITEDFYLMLENFSEFHPAPVLAHLLWLTCTAILECAPNPESAISLIEETLGEVLKIQGEKDEQS